MLDRVFGRLQRERIVRVQMEAVALYSTSTKVYLDRTGALKKRFHVHRRIRGGWTTKAA